MADGNSPSFTQKVNMSVFIEPFGGPTHPLNALDRFPDSIYHKTPDTHFVRFMYSLLGPAGLGWIKKQYLEAKLTLYAQGFNSFQIEKYYGDPFSFGRILEEELPEDPEGLLTREEWEKIKAKDESYRSRAITFFNAARAGGTPEGMELAAQSGLNHPAFIWENYKSLFDAHSDEPLGLPNYGRTTSTEEFIVIPRQTVSRSEQQVIFFAEVTASEGTFQLLFNGHETPFLPYTANNFEIEEALQALSNIGKGNVLVTGGPNPNPITITFTGLLSNQDVPTIEAVSRIKDNEGNPIQMFVRSLVGGVKSVDEVAVLSDEYQHNAQTAIDYLRPLNTLPTPNSGSGTRTRQYFGSIHASSSYIEGIKFVTGSENIDWPKPDSLNWVEPGKEVESKRIQGDLQAHYVAYHTISNVTSSTTHVGRYDVRATSNFDFLAAISDDSRVFGAINAIPACASPMEITSNLEGEEIFPLVEGQISATPIEGQVTIQPSTWWSSQERTAPNTETLTVDLGNTRLINWITFEVTRKPAFIRVEYDKNDAEEPAWDRVTLLSRANGLAVYQGETYDSSVIYTTTLPPWQSVKLFFRDSQNYNIATRYLRVTFSRPSPGEGQLEPFVDPPSHELIPYSIDVRNLRVGRYADASPTWTQ